MPTPQLVEQAQALLGSAIAALQAGDGERALTLLQDSLAANPLNPWAHYLLGAEYAQRQRYGDAVLHFTTAVEQDPSLAAARLQLGLLWLSLGNAEAAAAPLQPLASLDEGDPLRHFARALLSLCRDDLGSASAELRHGLRLDNRNAPLAADMQRLLAAIDASTAAPEVGSVSHGMAISAYTGQAPRGR
jgi:predicted Zn-dependent protease